MAFVFNWKAPKGVATAQQVKDYLKEQGIEVTVSQSHRVPSGKLNSTFDGAPDQVEKVWGFMKNLEKEELVARFKRKNQTLQP